MYNRQNALLNGLIDKMLNNQLKKNPLTHGFTEGDLQVYLMLSKEQMGSIMRALAYIYPKLKAIEHGTGTGDKIVFNFSGLPEVVETKPQPDTEEATIH